ncbi:hypothetical protein JCM19037_162 [Geomicrobium sp. JCM 19037]|uniref:sporulation inhibitor of replication protein SirA n=1 Tax=unclassified Geomicrobium TaxID=2628951 RepID=UPI00045F3B07|nr:sporulation inhibitor of replication protein SirA [Geomicrobium sp. JCM 19037]GAK01964.1 hypothetical protein JCM19037_162 [Geomicrobium sp. JCM 19037]
MHRYDIYLLQPDVAKRFIRAEAKLFQLFEEYETVKPLYHIVKKQIAYICRPLPVHDICEQFSLDRIATTPKERELLFMEGEDGVKVAMNDERMQIWSDGNMGDEWPWFDQLQTYDPYFFACDIHRQKYGWLKPIKFKSLLLENV